MNSIRKLITHQALAPRVLSASSGIIASQTRSMVYLHKGSRVRGLVRDEEDYLLSPKGKKYGINEENLQNLKNLLGEEFKISDGLALQILTHKSFAHGLKPFNEKLSILGAHFLKIYTSIYTVHNQASKHAEGDINGLYLGSLGTSNAKNLTSSDVMYEFIKRNNLLDYIFWKKRDPLLTDPTTSGENRISAGVVNALVGGILLQHGKAKAEVFIDDVLLNSSNEKSLVNLAKN